MESSGLSPSILPPANLEFERFSTLELTGANQVERWEEHNAKALVGLECRTLNEMPLEATQTNLNLPRLQFALVEANAHVVERSSRHIAATPTDGVALYFTLYGESFFYHRDGIHVLQPGDLLACDVDEPFMRGFAMGLKEYVVKIPRTVFDTFADVPIGRSPVTMRFSGGREANSHAESLAKLVRLSLNDPQTAFSTEIEHTALGILRSLFSPDDSQSHSALRRAAEDYIDQHLRDPRMSVAQVAQRLAVSERQLYRIFNETGEGVARAILNKRLDLAKRILTSPGTPSIGDVAARCGFSSHAHFSRVFRDRFGDTPAGIRQAGRPLP